MRPAGSSFPNESLSTKVGWAVFFTLCAFTMSAMLSGALAWAQHASGTAVTLWQWANLTLILGTGTCLLLGLIFGMIYLGDKGYERSVNRGCLTMIVGLSAFILINDWVRDASARLWQFDLAFISVTLVALVALYFIGKYPKS